MPGNNLNYYLLAVLGLGLIADKAQGQNLPGSNLILNPGMEKHSSSIEQAIENTTGSLRSLHRNNEYETTTVREDISRVLMEPMDWEKFCIFHGRTYCGVSDNHAKSGKCYMELRSVWHPTSNTLGDGQIAASLKQPLEPGCEYRFGIWVSRSNGDPGRMKNTTIGIQGLRGCTHSLEYSPGDSFYLEFNFPLQEVEVGEYIYFEGVFTALSEDTHLLITSRAHEFEFDRQARRIHRRCKRMKGGCRTINLAKVTFDDVFLYDINDCGKREEKTTDKKPKYTAQQHDFINLTLSPTDIAPRDSATFYFKLDHPHLCEDEMRGLKDFQEEMDGRIIAIHAYTDSTGSDQYNQNLSELRATHIGDLLLDHEVDPKAEIKGQGPCRSDTCTSMEQCRRAVIIWEPSSSISGK